MYILKSRIKLLIRFFTYLQPQTIQLEHQEIERHGAQDYSPNVHTHFLYYYIVFKWYLNESTNTLLLSNL